MSKWKSNINFKGFYHNDDLSIAEKGIHAAAAIQRVLSSILETIDETDREFIDFEIQDLIERFENVTGIEDEDFSVTPTEEFDEIMTELYDLADKHKIWIITV